MITQLLVSQASAPSSDPGVLFPQLIEAAKGHNWGSVIGLCFGLIVYGLTKLPAIDSRLPPAVSKWVPSIVAVLSAASGCLLSGGKWYESIGVAMLAALAVIFPSPKQAAAQ